MIAAPGKRYAQIVDGRVHWIFTRSELPEWRDDAFEVQDVTGRPEIVVGCIHKGGPSFDPPPPPPTPDPVPMQRKGEMLTACLDVEADAAAPASVKAFARQLRMWLATI